MVAALDNPDPYIRQWAAEQIGGAAPTQQLCAALIPRLDDQVNGVRLQAIGSLGKLRCRNAVPALATLLKDPEWLVRVWSAEALGLIGDPVVFPDLIALLGYLITPGDNRATAEVAQGDVIAEPHFLADNHTLQTFVARVTEGKECDSGVKSCATPAPGPRLLRRLSRSEYDATIHDLFNIESAWGASFSKSV